MFRILPVRDKEALRKEYIFFRGGKKWKRTSHLLKKSTRMFTKIVKSGRVRLEGNKQCKLTTAPGRQSKTLTEPAGGEGTQAPAVLKAGLTELLSERTGRGAGSQTTLGLPSHLCPGLGGFLPEGKRAKATQ